MLQRNTNNAWVAGVASGIAEEYNLSVTTVRMFFVLTFFAMGWGLLFYAWYWLSMPENNNQIHINFV